MGSHILQLTIALSTVSFVQTIGNIEHGYFDILSGVNLTSLDVSTQISPASSLYQTGARYCISTCISKDGCWAVKLNISKTNDKKTVDCQFYTLSQPPSLLEEDASSSKIAFRRWSQGSSGQDKRDGTCSLYLVTGEDGVPDENLSGSSWVYDYNGMVYHLPKYGRLNNSVNGAGAWCASQNKSTEWIQVYFGEVRLITGIVTQGRAKDGIPYWTKTYSVMLSNDGVNWIQYKVNGVERIFTGNNDESTPVTRMLEYSVFAAYEIVTDHGGIETWRGSQPTKGKMSFH